MTTDILKALHLHFLGQC